MDKEDTGSIAHGEEHSPYSSLLGECTGLGFESDVALSGFESDVAVSGFDSDVALSEISPVKRKKIDEDGFVTPTTPDIPKTSIHSVILGRENKHHLTLSNSGAVRREEKVDTATETTASNDASDAAHFEDATVPEVAEYNRPSEFIRCNRQPEQLVSDIGELLCRFGQEAKQYQVMMSEHFSNSATFEAFLPQRVDKILQDALALEQQLLEQKKNLKARLHMLGETLQQD